MNDNLIYVNEVVVFSPSEPVASAPRARLSAGRIYLTILADVLIALVVYLAFFVPDPLPPRDEVIRSPAWYYPVEPAVLRR